jgi:hypothetical protein
MKTLADNRCLAKKLILSLNNPDSNRIRKFVKLKNSNIKY